MRTLRWTVAGIVAALIAGVVAVTAAEPKAPAGEASAEPCLARSVVPPRRPRVRAAAVATPDVAQTADAEQVDVAAAPAPVPSRRLRIVDGDGLPVPGVEVVREGAKPRVAVRTDGRGEAAFEIVPRVGGVGGDGGDSGDAVGADVGGGAGVPVRFFDGVEERTVALDHDVVEVVAEHVPFLDLVLVVATTGAEVAPAALAGEGWDDLVGATPGVAGAREARRLRLDGRRGARVSVRPTPPAGFGAAGATEWSGPVAVQARRVRIVVPVYPATTRTFRGVDETGRPVAGTTLLDDRLLHADGAESPGYMGVTHSEAAAGASSETSSASRRDDGVVLRGVPRLPANVAVFKLGRYPDEGGPSPGGTGWRGETSPVRLDRAAAAPVIDVVVRPWDGSFEGPGTFCCLGCGSGCRFRRAARTAPVAFRVFRGDGSPARGVRVSVAGETGTTDADGVARLGAVPVGRATAVADAHGFLPTAVAVDVDAVGDVYVREADARTVRVTVVDDEGAAVPGARVTATSLRVPGPDGADVTTSISVAQLCGDVEIATPRTDRWGVVELRVPAGTVRYDVTLAAAATSLDATAADVRVVLAPPAGDGPE